VVSAALREAQEEIGLDPGEVEVVGRMRPTLSLHLLEVHPVVARIPHDFIRRARPNPEVRCFCGWLVGWLVGWLSAGLGSVNDLWV
jgi:8-oxo-dGTP pyrophosphatase MutT (NUDIX family)